MNLNRGDYNKYRKIIIQPYADIKKQINISHYQNGTNCNKNPARTMKNLNNNLQLQYKLQQKM